jgi:protein gp37
MAGKSSIEWTDATWNPTRGCEKISPGCKHCYAETFAERFRGVEGHPYEHGFDPRLVPKQLDWPLRRRKPLHIFVNSMSDLYADFVPFEYITAVYAVMAACHRHTFQVLTKRASRRREYSTWLSDRGGLGPYIRSIRVDGDRTIPRFFNAVAVTEIVHGKTRRALRDPWMTVFNAAAISSAAPLHNVHEGVSVEDRKYGVPRIDELRASPAAFRFLSIEPLLEDLGKLDLSGIDQVIVGAESGRRARPMNEDWVRGIRDQCIEQRVAFFYKQRLDTAGNKVSLPVLDGQQWAQMSGARA